MPNHSRIGVISEPPPTRQADDETYCQACNDVTGSMPSAFCRRDQAAMLTEGFITA
jgi:hypothetical protein